MIKVIDDFLSVSEFNEFSDIAIKKSNKWGAVVMNHAAPNQLWTKVIHARLVPDLETAVLTRFGSVVWNYNNLAIATIKKTVSDLPPVKALGFLYAVYPYMVGPHLDKPYGDAKFYTPEYLKYNYTSFYYPHKNWESNWGGNLCFRDFVIEPKPNRFVFYSLDEQHHVTQVSPNASNIRIVFKTSYFKYNDQLKSGTPLFNNQEHYVLSQMETGTFNLKNK